MIQKNKFFSKKDRLKLRFFRKIKINKTSRCWEWQASKSFDGYGRIVCNKRLQMAHRVSWLIYNGTIKNKLYVLHKCHNPPCVNPKHLYLGTHRQNMIDALINDKTVAAINKNKTHCKNGHPFYGENLVLWRGKRGCKICKARNTKNYKAKKAREIE